MGRPSLDRPTVRLLAASAKAPSRLEWPDGRSFSLSEPAFAQFLASFTPFALPLGRGLSALVIPEKRGRGGRYWVARVYQGGIREAVYIGARPDAEALRRAAVELSGRLAAATALETITTIASFGPATPISPAAVVPEPSSATGSPPDVSAVPETALERAWAAERVEGAAEAAELKRLGGEIDALNRTLGQQINRAALGVLLDSAFELFRTYRDMVGLSERLAQAAAIRDITDPAWRDR